MAIPSKKENGRFKKQPKEFAEELLSIDRVTRVTTGGRQLRFRAVMVIGDGKGRVALGTGKSWEVVDAIAKAVSDAKKKLVNVKIIKGTVPYNVDVKYKSAKLMIHPASEGTGIIAGGAARKVLMVAGYKDVLAKRTGSSNLINNARATIKALTSFKEVRKRATKDVVVPVEEKVEKQAPVKTEAKSTAKKTPAKADVKKTEEKSAPKKTTAKKTETK